MQTLAHPAGNCCAASIQHTPTDRRTERYQQAVGIANTADNFLFFSGKIMIYNHFFPYCFQLFERRFIQQRLVYGYYFLEIHIFFM